MTNSLTPIMPHVLTPTPAQRHPEYFYIKITRLHVFRSVSFKGPFIHKIMIRLGEFMLVTAECLFMGGGGGGQIKECETLTKGRKEKSNGIKK